MGDNHICYHDTPRLLVCMVCVKPWCTWESNNSLTTNINQQVDEASNYLTQQLHHNSDAALRQELAPGFVSYHWYCVNSAQALQPH